MTEVSLAASTDRQTFTIHDQASLGQARSLRDLAEVTIDTARLKHRGLMPCALRYAVWAVASGGLIHVRDAGLRDAASPAFEVPFNNVRQWVAKFCGRDTEIIEVTPTSLRLRRTSPVLEAGWGAGVVFSGREEEIPTLLRCLEGLRAQPELSRSRGGEIVVSGPTRDTPFLNDFPEVRYLVHETPPSPRFLICRKKNELIRALKGPRIAILHARVRLDDGCLASVPREFDMTSPNTAVMEGEERVPYLSLCKSDSSIPGAMPRSLGATMRTVANGDSLELHKLGPLFVDGGAFFVTKSLHAECPLDDRIAWEEGEDVDWCMRAFAAGYLMDLAPDAPALSSTSKLRRMPRLGPLTMPVYRSYRALRTFTARARHWRLSFKGER